MDAATKPGLDPIKTASKKVAHKTTGTTGEFIGKKITDKAVKPKPVPETNLRNIEEIVIPPEQRGKLLY